MQQQEHCLALILCGVKQHLLICTVQIAITSKLDCAGGAGAYRGTGDWQMADEGNLRWVQCICIQTKSQYSTPAHLAPDVPT